MLAITRPSTRERSAGRFGGCSCALNCWGDYAQTKSGLVLPYVHLPRARVTPPRLLKPCRLVMQVGDHAQLLRDQRHRAAFAAPLLHRRRPQLLVEHVCHLPPQVLLL